MPPTDAPFDSTVLAAEREHGDVAVPLHVEHSSAVSARH